MWENPIFWRQKMEPSIGKLRKERKQKEKHKKKKEKHPFTESFKSLRLNPQEFFLVMPRMLES